ncbi:hypothetical protein LMH87_001706 [Akanthomyces muscarius]|uniref:Mg2+ transporter protein, CorA-like/Zinc transport protein ZntB n=1 Tax=Akanthomyces muscarius TaxID=2231603 RepID=A0A9W8Q7B9_AKAMU|nr:hypothetical protein LMH87_001706 [Akanthomyces muscarius]KAJ4147161.1 hypothetical protein LMH87_001706 [Akanthomyces muscarius]
MADASADLQCANNCGPLEIWIWSKDGNHQHVLGHISSTFLKKYPTDVLLFIYADANTIRNCPTCKAKFSAEFNIPDIWWTEYNRKTNGFFGSQDVLDDAEKVAGYVTWSHFQTKQVQPDKEHPDKDYDYNWTKVNIFTQWLISKRQVVLSFAQNKGTIKTQNEIRQALLSSLVARELTDPFWVYHKLLSLVLDLNNASIWMFRDCVRAIEQSDEHTSKEPDYRRLHNLARHGIHIVEVLSVTCETIQRIAAGHRAWVEESSRSSGHAPPLPFTKSVREQLSFYEQTASSFRHRMLSTKDRLTNEINLSFNWIAQNDARITREISSKSLEDSRTMKKIAFLSFFFLPATFVSAIFSTSFFNFSPEAGRWTVSPMFWVYWVVTIPVTILMPVLWKYWHPSEEKQEDGDAGSKVSSMELKDGDVEMQPTRRRTISQSDIGN